MHNKINWKKPEEKPELLPFEIQIEIFGGKFYKSNALIAIYRNKDSNALFIGKAIFYKEIATGETKWKIAHYTDDTMNEFICKDSKSEFEIVEWTYSLISENNDLQDDICTWKLVNVGMFGFDDYEYHTSCKKEISVLYISKPKFCPHCSKKVV